MDKKELLKAKASAPVAITRYLMGWETSDIFDGEKKYRMEEDEDKKAQITSKELTEEQLEREIWEDQSFWDDQYEDLCQFLTEEMKKINPNRCYFKVTVEGFGWRGLDGRKVFRAENGRQLLQEILPECDCTFKIFKVAHGKKLAMSAAHHDSPMLYKEWYVITPCSEKSYTDFRN